MGKRKLPAILKRLRAESDVSQTEAAETCRVMQSQWSSWEAGQFEPGAESLRRIARGFGVSSDYLLGLE